MPNSQRPSLHDESRNDLAASSQALRSAYTAAEATRAPLQASASPDEAGKWDKRRFSCMISVCGDAHLAVETAIKSYTAAISQQHPSRGRSAHSIRELLAPLAPLSRQQQLDITAAMGERSLYFSSDKVGWDCGPQPRWP